MSATRPIYVPICVLACFGCTTYPASGRHNLLRFGAADKIQIFSLDPKSDTRNHEYEPPEKGYFHGYRIIGKTEIAPGRERARLLEALQDGMNRGPEFGAACFFPRHGMRAVVAGATIDFVICFECGWVHIYPSNPNEKSATTSSAPRDAFNIALEAHGVPLPPALQ